jgi:hypothetical protein
MRADILFPAVMRAAGLLVIQGKMQGGEAKVNREASGERAQLSNQVQREG